MTNFPLSLILLNIVPEKLSIVILNKRENIEKGKIIYDFLQNVIYELHEEAGYKEDPCILIGLS